MRDENGKWRDEPSLAEGQANALEAYNNQNLTQAIKPRLPATVRPRPRQWQHAHLHGAVHKRARNTRTRAHARTLSFSLSHAPTSTHARLRLPQCAQVEGGLCFMDLSGVHAGGSGAPECVHLDPGLLPPLHLIWLDSAAQESGKVGAAISLSILVKICGKKRISRNRYHL